MTVETPEDLAEKIADWLQLYGCCDGEKCREDGLCCRNMFVSDMTTRIEKSVENRKKLESLELLD